MSDLFDLAAAVATRINAGSYTLGDTFTAAAVPLVEYDMDDIIDNVIVECVPRGKAVEPLSRALARNELTIGVVALKTVDTTSGKVKLSDMTGLVEFTEELAAQLKSEDFTVNSRNAKYLRHEFDPVYDPAALYASQQFRCVLNVTYLMTTP